MVDITAVCAIGFAEWVEIHIPDTNDRTKIWFEKVSARASFEA